MAVNRFFLDAIRDVEKAESETDTKRAEDWLETAYSYEAEDRSDELGGSKEEHEQFLRNAVHTRPGSEFITSDAAQLRIEHLRSTGRFPEDARHAGFDCVAHHVDLLGRRSGT